MNQVWFFIIIIGMAWAAITGRMSLLSPAIFEQAKAAVLFALGIAGGMSFWSGMVKIADESGITASLGKIIRRPLSFLFPGLHKYPRALEMISLSLWANILGLGNASTPLGIKAMLELQKINERKGEPSDHMCTYLALVMSGFTILPSTIFILRCEAGSKQPGLIILPTILATALATIIALIFDCFAKKREVKKLL